MEHLIRCQAVVVNTVHAEIFAVLQFSRYFAVSTKIKIAKYFPISVRESSLEATSIFAAVTSSLFLLC